MRTLRPPAGQLDLFAESEAAEQQRRTAEAPTLFDTGGQGYFTRLATLQQWQRDYGHFACYRRSHAWHCDLAFNDHQPTDTCRPTLLVADLRCDCLESDCLCVGDLVYRGACLCCTWEGVIRDCENAAAEDAHDHAWPGWRDLPIAPRRPESGTSRQHKQATARWVATVNSLYPARWLQSGGPIRTRRQSGGTRHVPDHTGFGGYDLCGQVEPDPASPSRYDATEEQPR